jgi:hypothetical protein
MGVLIIFAIIFFGITVFFYERWKSLGDDSGVYRQFLKLSIFACCVISLNFIINTTQTYFGANQSGISPNVTSTIIHLNLIILYTLVILFCKRQLDSTIPNKPITKTILAGFSLVATTEILFGLLFVMFLAASFILRGSIDN